MGGTADDRCAVSAVRDEAGRYLYSVETVVDISARKAAEAEVRLHAAALEAAPSAVSLSKTDDDGTIVWVNRAFTRLTGYEPDEAIGRTHHVLSSGQQSQEFYRQLWETIAQGEVWRGELINRRKDGSLYQEEMGITPLRDDAGNVTHYVAIKQDITARKQAEAALREREARFRARARFDQRGEFMGYIGGCLDIDDRKRAEEELAAAKRSAEQAKLRQKRLRARRTTSSPSSATNCERR